MLRDDGIVMDDGTTSRLSPTHYLMTTTTVNAVKVMQQIEYLLQAQWPELEVYATSVTEQWSAAAISGPHARNVVAAVVDIDVSNAAFPFLAVGECRVRGLDALIPARLFRMSYSGELAYEIHVPADRGRAMWEAVFAAGEKFGLMPYGTEAMSTLRIEKGHVVIGPEADGRTTADDLGMGKLVSAAKWCIGKPLLERPALTDPDRWQLVGLTALDGAHDAARGEDRLRSRSCVAQPDAGPRDVVVLQSQSRCVDRAGAPRPRPRAAWGNLVGGVAARRCTGPRARRTALLHRSARGASACLSATATTSVPRHRVITARTRRASRCPRPRLPRRGTCKAIRRDRHSSPASRNSSASRFRLRPTPRSTATARWRSGSDRGPGCWSTVRRRSNPRRSPNSDPGATQ